MIAEQYENLISPLEPPKTKPPIDDFFNIQGGLGRLTPHKAMYITRTEKFKGPGAGGPRPGDGQILILCCFR